MFKLRTDLSEGESRGARYLPVPSCAVGDDRAPPGRKEIRQDTTPGTMATSIHPLSCDSRYGVRRCLTAKRYVNEAPSFIPDLELVGFYGPLPSQAAFEEPRLPDDPAYEVEEHEHSS